MQRLSDLYVAVARLWLIRSYSQDDDAAVGSLSHCLLHGSSEGRCIDHRLICRRHYQHWVCATFRGRQGCQSKGRCSVAANRFEQSATQLYACFAQLLGSQKAVLFTRDDDGVGHCNV